jgi:hypothetical protein
MKKTQKLKEAVQGLMSHAAQNYGCMSRPEPEEEYSQLTALKVLAEELFEDKQLKEDMEEQLSYFDDEDHKEFEKFAKTNLRDSIEYWRDIVAEEKSDHDEDNLEFNVDVNNDLKFVEQELLNESE